MLRVGLTGELGSGKSTVARLLADHGAIVLSSDEIARAMMQPGNAVYQAIVDRFGPAILFPDGQINRPALARVAFAPNHPRIEELNAIVHPPVLAEQERLLADLALTQPNAIAIIESALIFTTTHSGDSEPWRKRFDRIVVVTAPEQLKIQRYLARVAAGRTLSEEETESLRRDAAARLTAQRIPPSATAGCLLLANTGDLHALQLAVDDLWQTLIQEAQA
jgi:dephospho-CoA kinase